NEIWKQWLKAMNVCTYSLRVTLIVVNITYPSRNGVEMNVTRTSTQKKKMQMKIKPQTKKEITQAMTIMLRTLITLSQTLQQIPDTRYITMKLLYYDEITPPSYEPLFFRACTQGKLN